MYLNTDLNLTSKRLWKSLYCANADVFFPSASHFNIVRDLTKMGKACQHSCNVSLTTKCFSLQHRARHCKQKYFRKWLWKQHPAVCLPLSDEGWCAVDCLTLERRLPDMLWFIDYLDSCFQATFSESQLEMSCLREVEMVKYLSIHPFSRNGLLASLSRVVCFSSWR